MNIDPRPMDPIPFPLPKTRFRRRSSIHADIDRALQTARASARVGLHLGAGNSRIPGLINCDLYNPAAERQLDSCNLQEFADGAVDYIEHHHMFEHLSFTDADRALKEWSRVLRHGGLLVVTCPDIFRVCRKYVWNTIMNRITDREKALEYNILMIVGSQENEGMFHRNHYDRRRMAMMLPKYGFRIDFSFGYPNRPTPSLLTVARKISAIGVD